MNNHDFEELNQSARSSNLVEYFTKSGYTTERHGAEVYIKEIPGFCINQNTNKWYNHYESVGGSNAVDCLVKVCGRSFKQAVYELTGQDVGGISNIDRINKAKELLGIERGYVKFSPNISDKSEQKNFELPDRALNEPKIVEKTSEKKELNMPERAENMRRVFAYFCKERNIPAPIVEELVHAKLLYQSQQEIKTTINDIPQIFKTCNAVFVHRDEKGEAIGGEVQGVNSYKRYKGSVEGTGDSALIYTPFPAKDGKIKTAYLFESAIDLMSFYAFCKPEKMTGVALVSMAGLKPTVPKQLQEQGVNVLSCVDNDKRGRDFENKNGFKRGANMLEKAGVKDWNELLKIKIENPEAVKDFVPEIAKKNFFSMRKQ